MAIQRSATPKLRTKAVLRWDRFSGRHMLLYPERGLSLNRVASAIVVRCDGKHTVDAIVAELCDCFSGTEPGEVERDVLEFLDELVARGLLEGID